MDPMNKAKTGAKILDKLPDESGCKCIPAWLRYVFAIVAFFGGFAMACAAVGKSDWVFYILFLLGVIGAWLGGLFIKSPKAQVKHMTKSKDNIVSCCVILGGMLVTSIIYAFTTNVWAYIWTWILTYIALIWYSLSMVPGM